MFLLIFICLIAYLLGSISFSYLLTKQLKKVDIREYGSGNAGATNTLRVLGKGPAAVVFLLDVAKGMLAVFLAMQYTDQQLWWGVSGLLAIVGHNWPVFFGFRGGKGIATTMGVTLTLAWPAALIGIAIAILFIWLTRFVSLGSLLYTASLPISLYVLKGYPLSWVWLTVVMMLLAIYQHRQNIKRLWQGRERKLGENKEDKEKD
jgi:glycerol-3-phosphate acyltransferase PlsY